MIEQLLSQKIGTLHLELAQQVALIEQLRRELATERARADAAEKKLAEFDERDRPAVIDHAA